MGEVEPGQNRKVAALRLYFHVKNPLRLLYLIPISTRHFRMKN